MPRLTIEEESDELSDMKKITAQDFAREPAQALGGLRPHQTLAVTKRGKIVFLVSKPGPAKRRRLRAGVLLAEIQQLPMTEAEGDKILKAFSGDTAF